MSVAPTTKAVPNPAVLGQLQQIVKFDDLKARFIPLPKDKTHTTKHEWSKAYICGSFVLGALAAVAYKQAQKGAAIGFAVAAVSVALFKSRVTVEIPTDAYQKQCKEIGEIFKGVAQELRTTWEVAANLIAGVNSSRTYASLDDANNATTELVQTYLKGTWFKSNDPFTTVIEEQKPWRDQFKALNPVATTLVVYKLDVLSKEKNLHPVLLREFTKVHHEATRLLNGKCPATPNVPYVENRFVGNATDAKIVSQPWSVR